MEQQYYTKEELELLNTPSASGSLPSQPIHAVPENNAETVNVTPEQQELMTKLQSASTGVRSLRELISAAFSIVFGLVFMLTPLLMLFPMVITARATGEIGGYWLMPLAMVCIFVIAGGSVVVKGIKRLVKYIKNK